MDALHQLLVPFALPAIPLLCLIAGVLAWALRDLDARPLSTAVGVLAMLLALAALLAFEPGLYPAQYVVSASWVGMLGINLQLAGSALGLALTALSLLLALLTSLALWSDPSVERPGRAAALTWWLAGSLALVFLAGNLFFFYVAWELMLIPAIGMVALYGGPRRVSTAVRFFLYTLAGSLLMLVSILGVYALSPRQKGVPNLDLAWLSQHPVAVSWQGWLLLGFLAAFLVKVGTVPLHGWLPEAYSGPPPPVAAMLSGAMAKAGAYGLLRIALPLFPNAFQAFAPYIALLALLSILYGALVALMQDDLRRLLAYSSISHLGLITLGVVAYTYTAADGAALQMVNHGIATGGLFYVVWLLERRLGRANLAALGGLAARWPVLAVIFGVLALSLLGLPGLGGFAGEFLILLGVWARAPWAAVLGVGGVVLASWYLIRALQRAVHGRPGPLAAQVGIPLVAEGPHSAPPPGETGHQVGGAMHGDPAFSQPAAPPIAQAGPGDLSVDELALVAPLLALTVLLGLWPQLLLHLLDTTAHLVLGPLGVSGG
jgi:NADH-quinone oxidoreductase subunit M